MFSTLKDETKIKQIAEMLNSKTKETVSGSISYVGKANFGDIEKYITDFKTITISHTPLVIEISDVNVKFYLDYHAEQKLKYDLNKVLTDNLNTGSGGAKKGADPLSVPLEGVLSTEHKPSIAELQKLYMNSNIFIFTSQTAFLYQFPYDIFNTSRYSKCKIAFIIDRIANIKNYVDQNSLIPKTFNFNYQPIDTIAMMTLCGVVSILTTKWSIDYNEASEIINDVIEESVNKND